MSIIIWHICAFWLDLMGINSLLPSMAKTRIIIYLDQKETKAAEAKRGEHKNLHRWASAVVRRALK